MSIKLFFTIALAPFALMFLLLVYLETRPPIVDADLLAMTK